MDSHQPMKIFNIMSSYLTFLKFDVQIEIYDVCHQMLVSIVYSSKHIRFKIVSLSMTKKPLSRQEMTKPKITRKKGRKRVAIKVDAMETTWKKPKCKEKIYPTNWSIRGFKEAKSINYKAQRGGTIEGGRPEQKDIYQLHIRFMNLIKSLIYYISFCFIFQTFLQDCQIDINL